MDARCVSARGIVKKREDIHKVFPISVSGENLDTGQMLLTYPDRFTAIAALASDLRSEFTAMAVNIAPFGLHLPTSFGVVWITPGLRPRA